MIYKFAKNIYSKEALIKAAYRYTDTAYLHLDADNTNYIVEINSKDGSNIVEEKEFQNTILAEMVRLLVSNRTKTVRELILARAFSSTVIDNTIVEEPDELECDIDNILTDWFDNNE